MPVDHRMPRPSAPSDAAPRPRPTLVRLVWQAWVLGPLVFGLVAFPLTLVGQARRVARIRRVRLDGVPTSAPPPTARSSPSHRPGRVGRLVLAGLLTLVPLAVAFVLALLVVYLCYFGELYALRPDVIGSLGDMVRPTPGGENAWGGPTVIGAWFIHAMAALGMQVVSLALIRALGALCGAVTRRLIGV